jgi:predicted transcriptional regulator
VPHARPAHADDLQEITTRNRIARHMIEGFSLVFPTLASFWRQIDRALAGEIDRLRTELAQIRLDRANLAAAGRATIAAYLDGESRPLSYVRDELHDQGFGRPRGDS